MQDRFRVRGWSVFDSGYCDNIQNTLFGEEDNMTLLDAISKGLVNEIIPEQCTGLKDKNGKLIYEGDIVRVDGKVYYIDPLTLVVGFHNGAFMVGDRFIDNNSKFMEIIGNIHENPELLEDNE